jgi:hypothetical protein
LAHEVTFFEMNLFAGGTKGVQKVKENGHERAEAASNLKKNVVESVGSGLRERTVRMIVRVQEVQSGSQTPRH